MGKAMSLLSRKAMRPVKNFAVEARAEKVISREKPVPAPWHPTTEKRLEELYKENPDLLNLAEKKDEELSKRLKDVYVTSRDPQLGEELRKENPSRPLPKNRENVEPAVLGYRESAAIPKGKISIRQALLMIGKYQQDPSTNTAAALAYEYTINAKTAENILKHFRTFEYHAPQKQSQKIEVKDFISLKTLPNKSKTLPLDEDKKTS